MNTLKEYLNNLKRKIDYTEREIYVKSNPIWKKYYELWDNILDQKVDNVMIFVNNALALSYYLLKDNSINKKEIFIAFENLNDLLLIAYPEYNTKYSETVEFKLLSNFDSLVFETETHYKFIKELIEKIKYYLGED
ncbi:MAG: hypothetical protein AABW92_00745 [Nanoarchaeota archaeon]